MAFEPEPPMPVAEELWNAHTVLQRTFWTASSFLTIFDTRLGERGRGAPSDEDYDLLRAMLLFTCAGIDSMMKHIIREALEVVIERVEKAEDNFRDFVQRRLLASTEFSPALLTRVLTSGDPRRALIEELVRDLTSQSLQSKAQILKCGSFFDLRSDDLIADMLLFEDICRARNEIAHEMDIDFDQPTRSRKTRPRQRMVENTQAVLDCGRRFLAWG